MEDEGGFGLERAQREFVRDFGVRPGVTPEDVRELESDLRERVADGIKAGLTGREAFRQTMLQIGSPGELAAEFVRENPLPLWRERAFWVVWAAVVFSAWNFLTVGTMLWIHREFYLQMAMATWVSFSIVPLFLAAVWVARGALAGAGWLHAVLGSRWQLGAAAYALLLAATAVRLFGPCPIELPGSLAWLFLLDVVGWPFLLATAGLWLWRATPELPRAEATPKPASPSVWRERVFWMALGGLLTGFWDEASRCGTAAFVHAGNEMRPFSPWVGSVLY